MFKYLIGSMNGSYNGPCGRFASASWVSMPPGSISPIEKAEPMWFTFLVPVPNFHSFPSLNTRSEYRVPNKASYTGLGTRLVVERVRHHSALHQSTALTFLSGLAGMKWAALLRQQELRRLLPFFMHKNVGGSNVFGDFWVPVVNCFKGGTSGKPELGLLGLLAYWQDRGWQRQWCNVVLLGSPIQWHARQNDNFFDSGTCMRSTCAAMACPAGFSLLTTVSRT